MSLLVALSTSLVAGEPRLYFRSKADVSGEIVRLSDVAELIDGDASWESTPLVPAPAQGRSLRLDAEAVRRRLAARGVPVDQIDVAGASAIIVKRAKSSAPSDVKTASHPDGKSLGTGAKANRLPRVSPASFADSSASSSATPAFNPSRIKSGDAVNVDHSKANDVLRTAFQRRFQAAEANQQGAVRFELENRDVEKVLATSPERIRFLIETVEYGGPQSWVAVLSKENGAREQIVVRVWVDAPRLMATVARGIPSGRVIQMDDVELTSPSSDRPLAADDVHTLADVVGKQSKRTLHPGDVVKSRDLQAVPLAKPNDIITVTARAGGVAVRRPCKSLGAAGLRETLTAQPLDDPRERLLVRMTAYHEGEVVDAPAAAESRLPDEARPIGGSR